MSKPLSRRNARLLGGALQVLGIVGMLIALGRIEDAAATVLVIMCSGWLMVGTWVSTTTRLHDEKQPDAD